MKFELGPVEQSVIQRFEVDVQYIHGCTDYTVRHQSTIIPSGSLDDLEKYITSFNELRDMVEANRSEDTPYPDEYIEDFKDYFSSFDVEGLDGVTIELINDEANDDFDCFARMEIANIFYFDENGAKCKVSWKE